MKTEINPNETSRRNAFNWWISSTQPMVTVVKTFNVGKLRKASIRMGIKFNVLLCWCIGKAASTVDEFYLLPEDGKMYRYDKLAINVIVIDKKGGISMCDIPYSDNIRTFDADYQRLTALAIDKCEILSLDGYMVIGTSALPQTELDVIVNQYSGTLNNPFAVWGRYRRSLFKTTLPISFQFHHAQMDGLHACRFLNNLQAEINRL